MRILRPGIGVVALAVSTTAFAASPSSVARAGPVPPERRAACVPLDAASVSRAATYSQANGGQVLLAEQAGKTVLAQAVPGWTVSSPHRLASGTKSFAGVLAIAAAEDGLLDLDEPAALTLTEWASDPWKSRITVRQLLQQTSGLDPNAGWPGPDAYVAAIEAPTLFEPGTQFDYGPNHFSAFAAIVDRKVKAVGVADDPLDYLRARVLNPAGVEVAGWSTDSVGHHLWAAGARLTTEDWAGFGRLIMRRGKVHGTSVLEPALVDEMLTGSTVNPSYGMGWWLDASPDDGRSATDPDVPGDLTFAGGAGNQRLYVSRDRRVVVARLSEDTTFSDREFLGLAFDAPEEGATVRNPCRGPSAGRHAKDITPA